MVQRSVKAEGTVSGEHGIGVGKRSYLQEELGKSTIDLARKIKLSLDPKRILNPDKIYIIDPNDDLDQQLETGNVLTDESNTRHSH